MSKLTLDDLERDVLKANSDIQGILNKLTFKYESKIRLSMDTDERMQVGYKKPVLIVSLKAEI